MSVAPRKDRQHEWWVTIHWRGKRLRRRSPVQTKRDALAYERVILNELLEDAAAGRNPLAGPPPTFGEFVPQWLDEYLVPRKRPATVRAARSWLRNHLLPTFGHERLDQISARSADCLLKRMSERGLSPKSINNALSVLHTCLDAARRWNLIRALPEFEWADLETPATRALSEQEAQALADASDAGFWRSLVVFFLHTGLRFSEAAVLTWDDLDFTSTQPLVRVTKGGADGRPGPTKTGTHRAVPLDDIALDALKALPRVSKLIFPTPTGKQMNPASKNRYIHKFCDRAGIKRCGWHVLRHTYATRLAMEGVALPVVMGLLGHTSLKMTMRYVHPDQRVMNATAEVLSRVMPSSRHELPPNSHQPPTPSPSSPG